MTEVKQVADDGSFAQEISSASPSTLFVIYFHAPWAAPCVQVSAVLAALASTYPVTTPSSIKFLSLDAEQLPDVSEKYDVTAVPFIVLQKDGKTLETVSGSDAAKIRAAVEKYAGAASTSNGSSLPPAQSVNKPAGETVASAPTQNGGSVTKDLSGYAPNGDAAPPAETSKEDIYKRLEGLVKAAPVMLFMKGTPSAPQCGFSRQTVALLRERSIRYGFFNILADDDVRQGLKEFSDWPTFPQLYVDGELIGGLDIVKEEFTNNPEFLLEYSVAGQKPEAAAATA